MEVFEFQSYLDSGVMQALFSVYRTKVPGKVVSFSGNKATIQVAIQQQDSAGNAVTGSSILYEVPCLMVGGASNYITTALSAGDTGLLLVCDRDIDNFKASNGANGACATAGIMNLKDSIFIAGLFLPSSSGTKIYSSTNVTIQVGDSTSVTITPSQIQMTVGGATLTLTGSALVSSVPIEAPSYSGPDDEAALMTSGIDMNGQSVINASDVTTDTGVSLKTHTHDVTTGDGTFTTTAPNT